MINKKKTIKVGFDLDGVLADKPPLVPKFLLEYLFRGGDGGKLHYRYPKLKPEIWLRKLSHFYLFRPPIKRNIDFAKKLKKRGYRLYLISSRYSFLERETKIWLKRRGLDSLFEEIFLNLKDDQPHIFKEKILQKIRPDYYFEDDQEIVDFLRGKIGEEIVLADKRLSLNTILRERLLG